MLRYLSTDIKDEEISAAFDHIDFKKTNKIDFEELNRYFSKVNGIPEHLNKPYDPNGSNVAQGQSPAFFQQMYNPGYVPQYNPYPYQLPAPYYQPYPGMQGYYNPNPFGSPAPQQQQPQQPQPPPFNNYIMDQLSQKMNG